MSSEPRWKFWLARIFGRRMIGLDHHTYGYTVVISYNFRDKMYVWQIEHFPGEAP